MLPCSEFIFGKVQLLSPSLFEKRKKSVKHLPIIGFSDAWSREMADNFLISPSWTEEETSTREFSEGATSVLPGHSIHYTSALYFRHIRVRASSVDFNWAATLVLRGHIIVGVASKSQQFMIVEWKFGSQNFLALVSLEWRMGTVPYFAQRWNQTWRTNLQSGFLIYRILHEWRNKKQSQLSINRKVK